MIVQVIPQPPGDAFRSIGCHPSGQVSETAFHGRQQHEGERDPGQDPGVALDAHYLVDKVAQQ